MTDLQEQLEKCIQKAALDGALTKDAVTQFHGILDANEKLVKENDHQNKLIVEKNAAISEMNEKLNQLLERTANMAERERAVTDREKEITKLEMKAACEEQRVRDHKEMFTTVFRNLEVRRNVFTAVDPGQPDQYGTRQPGYTEENNQKEEIT